MNNVHSIACGPLVSRDISQAFRRVLLTLIFLLPLFQAGAADGFHLPAVFSDNMVLQQTTDIIMETAIWGWATPRQRIRVEFQGKKIPTIRADSKSGAWRIGLTKLVPGGPYNMLFYDAGTKELIGGITNVVVGEVWVLGSLNSPIAVFNPERARSLTDQMQSRPGGGFRLMTAKALSDAVSPNNLEPRWTVIQPTDLGKSVRFSNQAAYLAMALLLKSNSVSHVGIVETAATEAAARTTQARTLPEKTGGIAEAFAAVDFLKYARNDYLNELGLYRRAVAELKRSGAVTNLPPPLEIKSPTSIHSSSLKGFDLTIRGAFW